MVLLTARIISHIGRKRIQNRNIALLPGPNMHDDVTHNNLATGHAVPGLGCASAWAVNSSLFIALAVLLLSNKGLRGLRMLCLKPSSFGHFHWCQAYWAD
ncbi:hypothetical protein [Halioxenophilus aromaticivorans]|uniref:hypothetical protein n=1 Tax=Halioxenophilus aromaticivorans TaxID=1306992 RepID=UPI0031ED8FA8